MALHSSDPATVYLSCWARLTAPSREAVDDALYETPSVLRHHAMRRTLWVFTPVVAGLAHAACTEALALQEWKRLARFLQESEVTLDGAGWVESARVQALAALEGVQDVTARQFGDLVPLLRVPLRLAQGKPYAATQNAHTRVLLNLGFDGLVVRGRPTGSWTSSEYRWALASRAHPGAFAAIDPVGAAAELVDRYLSAFGPATAADVQWWAGWSATKTARALRSAGAVEVAVEGGAAWLAAGDDDRPQRVEPWVAFLPALDPTVMGWKQRDWYLGELGTFGGPLFDNNGNAGPTVWVDGRVVGGWAQRPSGEIVYRLLADVGAERGAMLAERANLVGTLIGAERVRVRFPAPMQKELLA